jgi:hypothetical protein
MAAVVKYNYQISANHNRLCYNVSSVISHQKASLEKLSKYPSARPANGDNPAKINALTPALVRYDTVAAFWLAMVRPAVRWYR